MLELKKISKVYETDNFKQTALNKVSICFRENEFVSILGPSGSGKTTLLNIVGGLDEYTSGDLIINGVSTKKYNDRDWDTYRNHKIGFVFQSYNLIPHQSILSNVELALTLSGVSKNERRRRAKKALVEVGLEEHINKRPNQLSGGQMQRVAIARALVNDPDILLADEPTGALDSKTSTQIMDLLKEVAKDRLVIMVTHNAELAEAYSTRIIEIKDGVVKGDTNPFDGVEEKDIEHKKSKKTSMSFITAFMLSMNNLMTKKGRTALTAVAGSIGIIGIALILSLSNGVQEYIDQVQEEALTSYPLTIESESIDMSTVMTEQMEKTSKDLETAKKDKNKIYSNNTIGDMLSIMSSKVQSNNLEEFKEFIEKEKKLDKYVTEISYQYKLDLQLYQTNTDNGIVRVHPDTVLENMGMSEEQTAMMMMGDVWVEMFENEEMNNQLYEILEGRMPKAYNEIVLLVDENNRVSDYVLYALGLRDQEELEKMFKEVVSGKEVKSKSVSYDFDEIVGSTYKVLLNTDYYKKENNIWVDKRNDEAYLKDKIKNAEEIKVVGIIKPNEDATITVNPLGGMLYTKDLKEHVIKKINDTEIVKEQKNNKDINIFTGLKFNNEEFSMDNLSVEQQMYLQSLSAEELADVISKFKEQASATYDSVLNELGVVDLERPNGIYIYAKDFQSKDDIKNVITKYNDKQEKNGKEENVINYNDLVGMLMSSVTSIVDMISYVLIGFVSISLVVSSIMIGIITYISVLERTKEIGILRAIGASKKDVSRVFNAETLIIGLFAGIFGIVMTLLLNIPINIIVGNLTEVNQITRLPLVGALLLIIISVILTVIAGLIPARMASKKDPVESLRTE